MSDSNDKKIGPIENGQEDHSVSASRRKFTKAALLASPVIMTAASKPVWATTGRQCTVSVLMSGGSAPVNMYNCRSCSPGYWHHTNSCWSTAGMAGHKRTTFGAFFLSGGFNRSHYYNDELAALDTPLEDFFPGGGNNSFFMFARAATASYLNAQAIGHIFHGNIPSANTILSKIAWIFKTDRTSKPSQNNFAYRKSKAGIKAADLATYYDEQSSDCILSNNGNCPDHGFTY